MAKRHFASRFPVTNTDSQPHKGKDNYHVEQREDALYARYQT